METDSFDKRVHTHAHTRAHARTYVRTHAHLTPSCPDADADSDTHVLLHTAHTSDSVNMCKPFQAAYNVKISDENSHAAL